MKKIPPAITRRDFMRNATVGLTAISALGTARAQGADYDRGAFERL